MCAVLQIENVQKDIHGLVEPKWKLYTVLGYNYTHG